MTDRVCDLSEAQLLERLFPLFPLAATTLLGPGDDAAVVAAPDGRFVVSTDVLVEGRHFVRAWSTGYDLGWRAAMQNLADIAAMGAAPTSLVVSLVVPPTEEVDWVLDLARGLAEAGAPGAGVVGGDLSSGDSIVVAVTVHGDLAGASPVRRSGARIGDVVAHAGVLGRSAAGLDLLRRDPTMATADDRDPHVTAYLRPTAALAAGPAARRAGATAMLDVSDGLLRDAARIATASGVSIDLLDPERSCHADVEALRAVARDLAVDPVPWILTGGEDHGMLATFPPDAVLPVGFRVLGQVRPVRPDGVAVVVEGTVPQVAGPGWDHFGG